MSQHQTNIANLLREIVAYCREAGHEWSSLAEAEAALATPAQAQQSDAVRVCPSKDIVCGDKPANWCATCPKRKAQAAQPAQAANEITGPSGDTASDFQEGQWWLKELDALVAGGTHDQKRAVSVVRNLMKTAHAQAAQGEPSYFRRDIGEGSDWQPCTHEQYLAAQYDPHSDTRVDESESDVDGVALMQEIGHWRAQVQSLQAQLEQAADALGYATRLASAIWERYWKNDAPNWAPCDNLIGVISQIDNMTSGMDRKQPAVAQGAGEVVAWSDDDDNELLHVIGILERVQVGETVTASDRLYDRSVRPRRMTIKDAQGLVGPCVNILRKLHKKLCAQPAAGADVRECLGDVVSHSNDFIKACTIAADVSTTVADRLYWQHQRDVYSRMAVQASTAIAASGRQE